MTAITFVYIYIYIYIFRIYIYTHINIGIHRLWLFKLYRCVCKTMVYKLCFLFFSPFSGLVLYCKVCTPSLGYPGFAPPSADRRFWSSPTGCHLTRSRGVSGTNGWLVVWYAKSEDFIKWLWINPYTYHFLGGWTSIYQLFWCSPGGYGFDPLPNDGECNCDPPRVYSTCVFNWSDFLI